MSFGFSIFLLLSVGWTPLLNYLLCATSPPTDWHQWSQTPAIYNDRYGLTQRNPHYSPNGMLNKIWKIPFKWSQNKKLIHFDIKEKSKSGDSGMPMLCFHQI